jgi:hypothetical protein
MAIELKQFPRNWLPTVGASPWKYCSNTTYVKWNLLKENALMINDTFLKKSLFK